MPAGTSAAPLSATDAEEAHLVFPESVEEDLQQVLFPDDPDHPFHGKFERGAFCILQRSTGTCRVSYLVQEVIEPESADDLAPGSHGNRSEGLRELSTGGNSDGSPPPLEYEIGFQFSEDYHRRAINRAKELGGGLLRVHTHPGGVGPSPVDKNSAERVFEGDVGRLPVGAPLVDAITNDKDEWSARIYEFGTAEEPYVTDVTAVRIVGTRLKKIETPTSPTGPAGARGEIDSEKQDSTVQMWDVDGQEILAGLRVGLVGCGGVGSILASHLPKLGVGELVLVDFDRYEKANLNRDPNAVESDVENARLKTDRAASEARRGATAPNFDTTVVDGSVVDDDPEYSAVPELLDCDVIIAVVDAARPRKILDHLATAHCIPVIDGGSRLYTEDEGRLRPESKIQTAITGPEFPSFECQRVWSSDEVAYERDHPRFRGERGYVDGGVDPDEEPRSPSVISINDIVTGIVQLRLQALVLGVTDRIVGMHRIKPSDFSSSWSAAMVNCDDTCGRPPTAVGDSYELPTGTDWSMRYERDDIPLPEAQVIESSRAEEILEGLD